MFTYTYSITVHAIEDNKAGPLITPLTGTVQAERYSVACTMAWQAIHAQCASIRYVTGREVCTSQLRLDRVEDAPEPVEQ